MATTKPSKAKPTGAVAAARKKQPPWLWIGLAAVVVVFAVIAAVSSSGGDKKSSATAANVEQQRPVTVVGTVLPKLVDSKSDPAVGTVIPELKGAGFDGTPIDIRNDGRPKIVLFVAHWCPHCQREVPLLAKYLASHPLPSGVDLYTVATATVANRDNYPPSAWLEKEEWKTPTMADSAKSEAADAFGLPGFPYFVAVDASGKVVARDSGELTTDRFAELASLTVGK